MRPSVTEPNAVLAEAIRAAEEASGLVADMCGGGHGGIGVAVEMTLRQRLLAALPARWRGKETGHSPPAPGHEAFCWLVGLDDDTGAAAEGHRAPSLGIGLLREGTPVLGVVHAPLSPDRGPELFAWAEGLDGILRNGRLARHRLDARALARGDIVLLAPAALRRPVSHARLVAPGRFVGLASIAHRLARVAAGDGVAAVSLSAHSGCDYAGGHALLRAAGGRLVDGRGREIVYTTEGESGCASCFGGAADAVRALAARDWRAALSEASLPPRVAPPAPQGAEATARDRAVGCLLGLLAGDSLGSLVEFMTAEEIARQHPHGVRDLADGGVWDTLSGQPTDDGELAIALARTLAQAERWCPEAVSEAYVAWLASGPFDVGGTILRGLRPAQAAPPGSRAAAARHAANPASAANGALMRCAPIGIWARDPEEAAEAADDDAALTHPNPLCRAASAAFAAAIAAAMDGGDRTAMLGAAEQALRQRGCADLLRDLAAARHAPPEDFTRQQGWVRIAWRNAFHHLAVGIPVEEAIVTTVGRGGDTDTNAAICGALLGAADGRRALPTRWTMPILSCRPLADLGARRPRPAAYWPDDAPMLAEALLLRRQRARSRLGLPGP